MPFEDAKKRDPICPEPSPPLTRKGFGAVPDLIVEENTESIYREHIGISTSTIGALSGELERVRPR